MQNECTRVPTSFRWREPTSKSCCVDRKKQEEVGLGELQHFALKALAKKAVVERGQLAHVRDEKLLLQNMNHPLILELFSTFQVCLDARSSASGQPKHGEYCDILTPL